MQGGPELRTTIWLPCTEEFMVYIVAAAVQLGKGPVLGFVYDHHLHWMDC